MLGIPFVPGEGLDGGVGLGIGDGLGDGIGFPLLMMFLLFYNSVPEQCQCHVVPSEQERLSHGNLLLYGYFRFRFPFRDTGRRSLPLVRE